MSGLFELFTDEQVHVRFRVLGPDGAVLAVSGAYPDKASAAKAITMTRETAGTGLIEDQCGAQGQQPETALGPVNSRSRTEVMLDTIALSGENIEEALGSLVVVAGFLLASIESVVLCSITLGRPKKPIIRVCSAMPPMDSLIGGPPLASTPLKPGESCISVLDLPLLDNGPAQAVLTLWSYDSTPIGGDDARTAHTAAARISIALRQVLRMTELKEMAEDLHSAFERRTGVDTAVGIIMRQNGCDRDTAARILMRASENRNIRLGDLADTIVGSVSREHGAPCSFDF